MKFEWYRKHEPAKMQAAKELFLREVNSQFHFQCHTLQLTLPSSYALTALTPSIRLSGPNRRGRNRQGRMPRGLMTSWVWVRTTHLRIGGALLRKLMHTYLTLKLAQAVSIFGR
jgi:hypothetical protein